MILIVVDSDKPLVFLDGRNAVRTQFELSVILDGKSWAGTYFLKSSEMVS